MDERIDKPASEILSASRAGAHDGLGERVASVLNAVEQTAERIRADAVRAANEKAGAEPRSYAEERRRRGAAALTDPSAMGDTARAAARRFAGQGQRRLVELRDDVRALERRFEAAIDELGELVSQLDDVVLSAGPGETATWPTISPRRTSALRRGS